MANTNLMNASLNISDGLDGVVIRYNYTSKAGGVSLNVTGYPLPNIRAGHVIIKETATGEFKPMPLAGGNVAYATLPAGHTYYGHAVNSVLTTKAMVGVFYHGEINDKVIAPSKGVFDLATIKTALMTALPHMMYKGDGE